ncbi:MAG: cytochrome c oxidase subunit II [Trebonia sp.]
MRVLRRCLPLAAVPLLAGCGRENLLHSKSPQEHDIVLLFWVMMGVACFGVALILFLLWLGWHRRLREGTPQEARRSMVLLLVLGVAAPIVSLSALFVWSDVVVLRATSAPSPSSTALTIDVIGHQWWWEVHYPGTPVVTANEIHIPTNTRVNVVATTADVIHSFWVPELNRKIDMIPGMRNRVLLDASNPGAYRGQCSQFCGLQHAHMGLYVVAQPPARFRAWLAHQGRPAVTPTTALAQKGKQLFMNSQCASCHTIAGTPAQGEIGPDLTHLATRFSLAGAEIPNNPHWLAAWIRNPQSIKPGDRMPDLGLQRPQITALVAYLDSLR